MKVSFLGVDYTVEPFPADTRTRKTTWGLLESGLSRISIQEGLDDQIKAETLLHEIIHVIEIRLDMSFDEHDVSRLAAGLLGVTIDGKRIVRL